MSSFLERISYLIINTDIKVSAVLILIYSIFWVFYNQFIRLGELKSEEIISLDLKTYSRKSKDFVWLYGLYLNSEKLGDYFKNLLWDRENLISGEPKIIKKYKFNSESEINDVFDLIDIIISKYSIKFRKKKWISREDEEVAGIWNESNNHLDNMLHSQREELKRLGANTSRIDALLKKYDPHGELLECKNVKALVTLLSNIMNSNGKQKNNSETKKVK